MVYILLADGFETAEALCPCDMLRRANVPVQLVGVNGPTACSGQKVAVQTDITLDEVSFDEMELLMLPGGLVGVDNILASDAAMDLICKAAAAGKYVAAICAAPTILGKLGLLEGKRAVCYPGMEGGLTGAQPCVGESVVVDGNIVTGEAAGSSIAFGLKLVELLRGAAAEQKVHQGIHYHG
ncbi:MAG: DJ-1/PfpI family protein [Clostridiales bacterium]|nr:DJ-1/PfpI family protein [Clostridiales bacterium]